MVFESMGRVAVEEFEVEEPGEGELLVKTICTAISPGTETAFLLGLPNTPRKYPIYSGWEVWQGRNIG